MSTLVHHPLPATATPPLRLLERQPARRMAAPEPTSAPSWSERIDGWLAALPEPGRRHRLGSWTTLLK